MQKRGLREDSSGTPLLVTLLPASKQTRLSLKQAINCEIGLNVYLKLSDFLFFVSCVYFSKYVGTYWFPFIFFSKSIGFHLVNVRKLPCKMIHHLSKKESYSFAKSSESSPLTSPFAYLTTFPFTCQINIYQIIA